LVGSVNDPSLVIDPYIDASNNVLAVTGQLNIYAPQPATVWTKLTAFANAGDTTIQVISTAGWAAGDELVIGPSGRIP